MCVCICACACVCVCDIAYLSPPLDLKGLLRLHSPLGSRKAHSTPLKRSPTAGPGKLGGMLADVMLLVLSTINQLKLQNMDI